MLLTESFLATGPVGDRGTGLEVLVHADLDQLIEATGSPPTPPAAPPKRRALYASGR